MLRLYMISRTTGADGWRSAMRSASTALKTDPAMRPCWLYQRACSHIPTIVWALMLRYHCQGCEAASLSFSRSAWYIAQYDTT